MSVWDQEMTPVQDKPQWQGCQGATTRPHGAGSRDVMGQDGTDTKGCVQEKRCPTSKQLSCVHSYSWLLTAHRQMTLPSTFT